MRLYRFAFPVAVASLAVYSVAGSALAGPPVAQAFEQPAPERPVVAIAGDDGNYDIDLIVGLSGKCTTFNVAGQNLPCRAVKYFHGESGRADFTVAIDDPTD